MKTHTSDASVLHAGPHGRRAGKKLRPMQAQLMRELLPKLRIDDPRAFVAQAAGAPIWLEIGFGGGEHLASQASANRHVCFIGCEPFRNGVAKLVFEVAARDLDNVAVHFDDAVDLMRELPPAAIDRAYLLFPDPWPKRRQKKRRFINDFTVAELARILKPGAELRMATDIDDYAGWALSYLMKSPDFVWNPAGAADWDEPWPDHCRTRYEEKARAKGARPVYLTFQRR